MVPYASRVWLPGQKGPGAVVRPAAKGLILWSKKLQASPYVPHKRGMQRGTGGGFYNEVAVVASNAMDTKGPPLGQGLGAGPKRSAERARV